MAITLTEFDIALPGLESTEAALLLSEPMPISEQSQQSEAMPWPISLIAPLNQFLARFEFDPEEPIFWLLPNLAYDEQRLNTLISALNEVAPNGRAQPGHPHPVNEFFAHGESALHCALIKAMQLAKNVTFIALDEQFLHLNEGITYNNGAAFALARVKFGETGLHVPFCHGEPCFDIEQHNPFPTLLSQAVKEVPAPIEHIVAPALGEEPWPSAWLEGYLQLNGKVVEQPKVTQSEYVHGQLGAVFGLYSFIGIYKDYNSSMHRDIILHLGSTPKLYQAASVYQWID
ncbi:hypothetical protein FIU82_16345 (plasmid) [Pseudoalteromonas sp. THAF3]|uniref:hypothetical protein n=1 Tax=Pseudoalteromonas sp. THAF3 TaxID=2587843 RepID=UPI001268A8BE|nr:hypothetical protein [Pseudoalteromonas sp. THAF3]QFU06560.1 hypothetical protein FIU82_16345 [Pseudoalteromonas sp. THAF3]